MGYIGGLVIGGILCQSPVGWRSLFWVQAALGAIFAVMAWFCLPPNHPGPDHEDEQGQNAKIMLKRLKRIDWVGAGLSTAGLGLFTFSLACVFRHLELLRHGLTDVDLQWRRVCTKRMENTLYSELAVSVDYLHGWFYRMGAPTRTGRKVCPSTVVYLPCTKVRTFAWCGE